jgi:RHS repeat-associated protein
MVMAYFAGRSFLRNWGGFWLPEPAGYWMSAPERCKYVNTIDRPRHGLRTNMVDASGTTTYQYDNRNRLGTKTTPQGTLNYGYNANGQVTNITSFNTNGMRLSYSYDALNRLSEVNDVHAGITTYTYDDVGNLRGYTYPNGVNTFYDYNALNCLTNMNVSAGLTPVANYAYTLASSGHRTNAIEILQRDPMVQPTTLTRLYRYDITYRLTNETIGGTSYSTPAALDYSYDKVGNRLQLQSTQPGIVSALSSYDANDRLNTTSAEQFDDNGNTLFASGFAMTQADRYDFENRLLQRSDSGKTVGIVYDGDGNRVKKTVTMATNTVTTWFLVDTVNPTGYAQVLEEITTDTGNLQLAAPQVTRTYSYGHDLISQDRVNGNTWTLSFYGYDGHGNTRFLTDANANVTDAYDYDAFGNVIARTGTTPNLYLFTGEQYDSDLGLYFLRARYQNTQTGRFWTMDSYEGAPADPSSLHKYLYAQNNPVSFIDPSGNMTLKELVFVIHVSSIIYNAGSLVYHLTGAITAATPEERQQKLVYAGADMLGLLIAFSGGGPTSLAPSAAASGAVSVGIRFVAQPVRAIGSILIPQGVMHSNLGEPSNGGNSSGSGGGSNKITVKEGETFIGAMEKSGNLVPGSPQNALTTYHSDLYKPSSAFVFTVGRYKGQLHISGSATHGPLEPWQKALVAKMFQ